MIPGRSVLSDWSLTGRRANILDTVKVDFLGKFGDCRCFEQHTQRQLDAEYVLHPRNDLSRAQRVTSEIEKVVVNAETLDVQDLAPDPRQAFFRGRTRGDERFLLLIERGRRQARTVEFAVSR